ncbi:MAG: NAD(P)-dependent oxidoreductase [Pseudomonadota bacterium]|nr:NAD(P)-dependent oxidoreductase [Pseudomonadota bacterium]
MPNPKVAVVVPWDQTGDSYKFLESEGCKVSIADTAWSSGFNVTREEYLGLCGGADAIIGARIEGFPITADLLAKIPKLRIYCRYNIGYDDIDIKAATECGVIVTNSPVESNWGAVAENTFAFMLALLKNLKGRDVHVKEGGWREDEPGATYLGRRHDGYSGIAVGIIGLGRIGSRLCDLMQPWRMRILACDPYIEDSRFIQHNAEQVDMETLLGESDVVTLHCDLNDETRHLMSEAEFDKMKSTALFINAARGGLVDQDALFHALDKNLIAGAAIDVFETEPPPKQSPLLSLGDKILLAPHTAGRTTSGGGRPTLGGGENITLQTNILLTALRGEVPKCVVNPEVLPAWRKRFIGKNLL